MLMKPMQKITRYPLLFRRLLPNTIPDSPEHTFLSKLIVEMEKAVSAVNHRAHIMQAKFKTMTIGKTLDFNTVCEVSILIRNFSYPVMIVYYYMKAL